MSVDLTTAQFWRVCGRCDGYMCRDCFAGEVPCCHSCGESPETYTMTMADAEAWVADCIAHDGNCPACVDAMKRAETERDPLLDHESSGRMFTNEEGFST